MRDAIREQTGKKSVISVHKGMRKKPSGILQNILLKLL